jgi:hypothetical protein
MHRIRWSLTAENGTVRPVHACPVNPVRKGHLTGLLGRKTQTFFLLYRGTALPGVQTGTMAVKGTGHPMNLFLIMRIMQAFRLQGQAALPPALSPRDERSASLCFSHFQPAGRCVFTGSKSRLFSS